MHRGYIKLYRKMTEWEWYKNIPVRVLFEHCLIKANIEDKKWQGIVIKKGSFVTSLDNLVNETGLTKMQVRTAIEKLKMTHEITHRATRHYSIITINNFDLYQDNNTQNNTQITHKQHTDNTQITLTKEDKNIRNIIYAQFVKFYEAYPKKKSKQAAERAFNSAIKKVDFETIMKGLNAYKEEIKRKQTEEQYIKYPATWLNQGCWDDTYQQEEKYVERPYKSIGDEYNWGDEINYDDTPYRANR